MIVRSSLSWFRLLFVWHGSVLPRIMPRLLLVLLIAIMSAGARHWWLSTHADSALSIPTFTLLGVSLAIFLVFAIRSVTTALGGPQIVGWLADCQSLITRLLLSAVPKHPLTAEAADLLCAFAYALKAQLRRKMTASTCSA
jgi:putative membrane protein